MVPNGAVRRRRRTATASLCAIWTYQGVCVWGVRIFPPLTLPQTSSRSLALPPAEVAVLSVCIGKAHVVYVTACWGAELIDPRGRPDWEQREAVDFPQRPQCRWCEQWGEKFMTALLFSVHGCPMELFHFTDAANDFWNRLFDSVNTLVLDWVTFGIESWNTVNPRTGFVLVLLDFFHFISVDVFWIAGFKVIIVCLQSFECC